MLNELIIVALGVFTNGTTGQQAQAVSQVSSVTECAEVINANREPREYQGDLWYLTSAECKVIDRPVASKGVSHHAKHHHPHHAGKHHAHHRAAKAAHKVADTDVGACASQSGTGCKVAVK